MTKSLDDFRGSRRHMLEWIERPEFLSEINAILVPIGAVIPPNAPWRPRGVSDAQEARLETLGPDYLPTIKRDQLRSWWLKHEAGANTPNWDFLSPCTVDETPGLVLIEAKANKRELSESPKRSSDRASARSRENHEYICAAIEDASKQLAKIVPNVSLSAKNHYQLANRLAFAWKLASIGIPVVLIYLGFTGDEGIRDAGDPFENARDWTDYFIAATKDIFPEEAIGQPIKCGPAPFWFLLASRRALSQSPKKKLHPSINSPTG